MIAAFAVSRRENAMHASATGGVYIKALDNRDLAAKWQKRPNSAIAYRSRTPINGNGK
jgi:hypothetical protein